MGAGVGLFLAAAAGAMVLASKPGARLWPHRQVHSLADSGATSGVAVLTLGFIGSRRRPEIWFIQVEDRVAETHLRRDPSRRLAMLSNMIGAAGFRSSGPSRVKRSSF